MEKAREQGIIDDETEIISEEEFQEMFGKEFEGENWDDSNDFKTDEKTAYDGFETP